MSDVLAIALSQMEHYRTMKYLKQLQAQLDTLNVEMAEELCVQMHEAELEGYVLSDEEERLWLKLTDALQTHWTDNAIQASSLDVEQGEANTGEA